jgi:hypothetical protein
MERINLETGESPEVRITRVAGSLQLKGWGEDRARIEVQHQDDLKYTFRNDVLEISAQSDCILRIPEAAQLEVSSVSGNAFIAEMENDETKVGSIGGSLTMKNMGPTTIELVSGTLSVRGIEGDLDIEKVSGNTSIRDVEGRVEVRQVGGNLGLRDIEGDIVARTHGNADLRLEPEDEVQVEAEGNLFCYLDENADADVTIHSGGQYITIDTSDGRQMINKSDHKFTLGDGGVELRLSAAGNVDLRAGGKAGDFNFDLDLDFIDEMAGLADEITEQVGAAVGPQIEALNEQLTALGDRLRNSGDRRANAAQRRVEHAQRRLERKLHGRAGRVTVTSSVKPAEPVSAKERALILQMVQDKKINVTEAEMLLNTLEGKPADTPAKSEPAASAKPEEEKKGEENA